jgi:uncharacterized protein (TIGR03435 family)
MRTIIAVFVFAGTTGLALRAQSAGVAPVSHLEFEAAVIRPSGVCDGGGAPQPGRLRLRCITVGALIQMAYGYFANGFSYTAKILQISGAPGWVDSDRYDIEATAEGNPSQAVMRGPMLQALLEDRFGFRFHRETTEGSVYALTVAKGGIRMARMEEGTCTPVDLKRPTTGSGAANLCGTETRKKNGQMLTVSVHGISLADLADGLLVELAGRTVIDRTGIGGLFDLHIEFSSDQNAPIATDDAAGPSIFTALQEQLGLKLESARGPVKLFVIDRVERPSGN